MNKIGFITCAFRIFTAMTLGLALSMAGVGAASAAGMPKGADSFYRSKEVAMEKVTFKNQYNLKVVGNLFVPKELKQNTRYPALVVGHPMGAVKEQSANLYAVKMAERGFVTLSLDLSFWGESEGQPRNAVAPDIYAEDFSAAVDFLGTRPFVDRERIGAIGICGSGSFVISAAKIDPRMKAIATVSMYDMGAANRNALKHSMTLEQRKQVIAEAAAQRYIEFTGGETKYTSGTVHELKEDTHPIQREFFDFYRTPRGEFTPNGSSSELTTHPTLTSNVKFMNFYPFNDIETISPRPMLFITGENAHSREFSEDAYKLAAEPKELYIVPGAGHVDLYDRVNYIPFDKLTSFFTKYLQIGDAITEAQAMDACQALTARQQNIVTIAAFTASGDIERLKMALHEGLDAGLTVNEIKEILVQLYAYAGFPRSLNGIGAFMTIMEERERKGINDKAGREPGAFPKGKSSIEIGTEIQTRLAGSPVKGPLFTFAPAIDQFLKGHLFGDIFVRDNLDFQSREIATISALAAMKGVNSQLQAHFGIGLNTGLSEAQMRSMITVLTAKVGKDEADNADDILSKALNGRSAAKQI